MSTKGRSARKQKGGEQLLNVLPSVPIQEVIEDFQVYNQLLQEECYLVFEQLHTTGQFVSSLNVENYETVFADKSFTEIKEVYNTLIKDLETDDFVIDTVFTDVTISNSQANVLTGGGLNFGIDLSSITPETVGSYSAKILLSVIKQYQAKYQDLSLQQQESLKLCITEYQIQAMTSLNKLYLGDVGVTVMLYGAFVNMSELLSQSQMQGGDLKEWMNYTTSLARQSVDTAQQTIRGLATKTGQVGKTFLKIAHEDVAKMTPSQKMNILQNLFSDMLKWGGKQLMLRLRAPEFDIASISDMSDFKQEMLKFIGNRISQIMRKSENFRQNSALQDQHIKWLMSVVDNIESLLSFIQTISDLALPSSAPDLTVKVNVSASMSSGIKVNLETSQWLKEIRGSVDSLKEIIGLQKDKFNFTLQEVFNENYKQKKAREIERQLQILKVGIQKNQAILSKNPDNNLVKAQLGRQFVLRDKLLDNEGKNDEQIEDTCVQLLQEIHTLVSSMNIPHVPLDILSKKVIQEVATKVDHSAFTSVSRNVLTEVNKVDIGLRSYFTCIGKYLEFCPNISTLYKHIGFTLPDLHNVINKLGTISANISSTASGATAYLQIVNVCLLLIHLTVSATLNCRNKTLNKEKVTLEDIKRASQERMSVSASTSSSTSLSLPKIGARGGKLNKNKHKKSRTMRGGTLPPLMYSQGRTLQMRKGLVDQTHTLPFFAQGRKAVLNERVKSHSIRLLEPRFTEDQILRGILTQSVEVSSSIGERLINNVKTYMYANELSLGNNRSVLDNLKEKLPQLSAQAITSLPATNTCTNVPSQLTAEEDVFVLSMFAAYQGQQLRNSFNFNNLTPTPSQDSLYCSVSQGMQLEDERLKTVVASIVSNFNGDTSNGLIGGNRKRTNRQKLAISKFLETKSSKELFAYASTRSIPVTTSMRKSDLIKTIINMKI